MLQRSLAVTIGCLLRDIGEVIRRSGTEGDSGQLAADWLSAYTTDAEILRCVRVHRDADLAATDLPDDSVAYIARLANAIASGGDGKGEASRHREGRLGTIFNRLNGACGDDRYPLGILDETIPYPVRREESGDDVRSWYAQILGELQSGFSKIAFQEDHIGSLLNLLENLLSFVPSGTCAEAAADISLYDHAKTAAAVGAAMSEYLAERGITDCKAALYDRQSAFLEEEAFLMVSWDFSGIQSFLYNIVSEGALKSLRSRSFILQLLMEHGVDEILLGCGLSRANLIYSGGGHCYILLPNTKRVVGCLERYTASMRAWLRRHFGTALYMASAWRPCSANQLMNRPVEDTPYQRIYQDLSAALAAQKLSRYTPDEIRELNSAQELGDSDGRECKMCGRTDHLSKDDRCPWCENFKELSPALLWDHLLIAALEKPIAGLPCVSFPGLEGDIHLCFVEEARAKERIQGQAVRRIYAKSAVYPGLARCIRLDYCHAKVLDELSAETPGVERIGVLRADVDNLGRAFIKDFVREDDAALDLRYRYIALARSAAFSRHLSLFFQHYIQTILKDKRVIVVYSGGGGRHVPRR